MSNCYFVFILMYLSALILLIQHSQFYSLTANIYCCLPVKNVIPINSLITLTNVDFLAGFG